MNILILGGHQLDHMPYHDWLLYEENNLFVFMDEEEVEKTCSHISQNIWEKYQLIKKYKNYFINGQVELDAIELHRKYKIDRIVSFRELEILRAAKLRDYLGIPGQRFDSALVFRDKVKMKEVALRGGLKTPAFSPIKMVTDLHRFIETHGYPVFVKPIAAAGSVNARALRSEADLRNFVEFNLAGDIRGNGYTQSYHVEKYVEGDFFNVDGVVVRGELVMCSPGRYNAHADMENIGINGYWSSTMFDRDSSVRRRLVSYIDKLLKVLPTPQNTVFHSEVFIDRDGEITLCEIAVRPPGGGMWTALNHAFNIDILKLAVTLQWNPDLVDADTLKQKNAVVPMLTGSILLSPKEAVFRTAVKACPLDGVIKYDVLAKENVSYSGGKNSCDAAAIFVIKGTSDQDLRETVKCCVDWFWKNSLWEQA
ncbi:MAG: hypothetical protein ACD_62C00225G0005 [uncultured bacterium]|nr:MAG: hypothetical protein ACD_62C00225G0005 [uncultured bacterium]